MTSVEPVKLGTRWLTNASWSGFRVWPQRGRDPKRSTSAAASSSSYRRRCGSMRTWVRSAMRVHRWPRTPRVPAAAGAGSGAAASGPPRRRGTRSRGCRPQPRGSAARWSPARRARSRSPKKASMPSQTSRPPLEARPSAAGPSRPARSRCRSARDSLDGALAPAQQHRLDVGLRRCAGRGCRRATASQLARSSSGLGGPARPRVAGAVCSALALPEHEDEVTGICRSSHWPALTAMSATRRTVSGTARKPATTGSGAGEQQVAGAARAQQALGLEVGDVAVRGGDRGAAHLAGLCAPRRGRRSARSRGPAQPPQRRQPAAAHAASARERARRSSPCRSGSSGSGSR